MFPKLYSAFLHRCPRCLDGAMFPDKNPYHLSQTARMHSHCIRCGLNFEPEPGYFYGAMYVSYAFTVALSVGVFLLHYFFFWELGILFFMIILSFTLVVVSPYTFRTSRAIWLNFFNKYDPSLRKELSGGK